MSEEIHLHTHCRESIDQTELDLIIYLRFSVGEEQSILKKFSV
jgi:hypothetical protein